MEARGFAYQARFRDLWVAAGDSVEIDGLHTGDRDTQTPAGGAPLRALADDDGQARLLLPLSGAVGTGTVGPHLRRSFTRVAFAGGDVDRFQA